MTQQWPDTRTAVSGYSLVTGWGAGLKDLPGNVREAADGRVILPLLFPPCTDERLRRATRECALAVRVVEQALANATLTQADLAGPRTAVVYASASAYAAANWAFLANDTDQVVYFPYTAPIAVPGEVTMQYGITGPYLSFLSGANAGLEALWHALTLLNHDQCDRALVLGVETFVACEALYTSGRWFLDKPLVEVALCLILERDAAFAEMGFSAGSAPDVVSLLAPLAEGPAIAAAYLCGPTVRGGHVARWRLAQRWPIMPISVVNDRVGTCLASMPLIALLLSLAEGNPGPVLLISRWWDQWVGLRWPVLPPRLAAPTAGTGEAYRASC
jgi:hypothetical protein